MNNKITTKMNVQDNLINVMRVNNIDYISLTDLAKYKNADNPVISIRYGKNFLMKILN